MARIAVIGGGLAGLVVALRRANANDDVVLYEAAPRFGGQLHSERSDGFLIEHGAEGFVAGSDALPAIAASAGVGDRIVDQLVSRSYGFDGTSLLSLAPGEAARFLGFQVARDELGRGIRSFRCGMQELTEALERAIGDRATLNAGTRIERLERAGARWRLRLSEESRQAESFDAVVVATSAVEAARMLADEFGAPASELGRAETVSSLTVSLAFPRDAVDHPLDGTGFVVATDQQQEGFRACTFASSKLPDRAPEGHALLRSFFRPSARDLRELDDSGWAARAARQLARALPLRSAAERTWISRWSDALPVFDSAHRERVEALEQKLRGQRLWLAGAAFHGSGIDAAVRSAERTALLLDS